MQGVVENATPGGCPLVSIVIPCYNAATYIGSAIESALEQTYKNVEVVVVDDGSRDGSLSVIRGFGSRVVCEASAHRGGGAARNVGIQLARGELIQFLDSDDVLLEGKVARQVDLILSDKRSSVFGWYEHRYPSGGTETQEFKPPSSLLGDSVVLALRHIIQIEAPLHWTKNVRTLGGFDEKLPCNQDYDFNLRMAASGVRFVYDGQQSSRNLRREGSVSSDRCRRHRVMLDVLSNSRRMLEEQGALSEHRREAIAHLLASLGRALIGCGEIALAKAAIKLAFDVHPGGGVATAYDGKSRIVRTVLGPVLAEYAIGAYQRLGKGKAEKGKTVP